MKGMTLEAVAKACDGIYHGSDGDKIKKFQLLQQTAGRYSHRECLLRLRVQEVTGMLILIPVMIKERSAVFPSRSFRERKDRTFR